MLDQFTTSLEIVVILLQPPLGIISESVVSSVNLCSRHPTVKSLINTKKISGPRPWGMPPLRVNQSDKHSENLTRCCRSIKKEQTHRAKTGATPRAVNLRITVEWSAWSNAMAYSQWTPMNYCLSLDNGDGECRSVRAWWICHEVHHIDGCLSYPRDRQGSSVLQRTHTSWRLSCVSLANVLRWNELKCLKYNLPCTT